MSEKTLTKPVEQREAAKTGDNGVAQVVQNQGTKESLAVLREVDLGKSVAGLPKLDLTDSRSETSGKTDVTVKKGDTLSEIVAKHLQRQEGESGSHYVSRIYKEVGNVAKDNGIANPDKIYDGQKIHLDFSKSNKNGTRTEVQPTPADQGGDKKTDPNGAKRQENPVPSKGGDAQPDTKVPTKQENPVPSKGGDAKPDPQPTGTDKTKTEDKPPERLEVPKIEESKTPLTAAEFSESGAAVLKKIHPDGSPATKGDLAKALEDPSITGKEAQALAAIYKNFDHLYSLNGSDGLFHRNSVSAEDLAKYPAAFKTQSDKVQDIYGTKFWADNNFSKYAGADGTLKESEIDKALADAKTPPEDKLQLEKLKKLMPDIGHGLPFFEKGMSKEDIDKEAKRVHTETPEAKRVNEVEFSLSGAYESQKSTKGVTLYRTENPMDSIKPDAIRQGAIGNCYFEASLAAVASSRPDIIRDSIRDNKNGTYTVTFPGAKDEPITVKAPTEAEMALYNRGGTHGTWAAVMEKAYGKYRDNHAWIGSYTPQEAADGGGNPSKALELLTGGSSTTLDTTNMTQKELATQLERAFSGPNPKAVTASSSAEWKGFFGGGWNTEGNTADGFIRNHAFTITGFKPDGKGGGMVQMRNPWGGADGPNGKIEIPLEMLPKNFWRMGISDTK